MQIFPTWPKIACSQKPSFYRSQCYTSQSYMAKPFAAWTQIITIQPNQVPMQLDPAQLKLAPLSEDPPISDQA